MEEKPYFICDLPLQKRKQLKKELKESLIKQGKYTKEMLDEGMGGTIYDVEELVDIKKYIN